MTPEQAIANFTGVPVPTYEKQALSPLQHKIYRLHRDGIDRFQIARKLNIRTNLVRDYLEKIREKGHEI